MPLEVEIQEKRPGLFEVSLDGRLDTETSGPLEKQLAELLAKGPKAVRFNMEQLSYISSMGIRVLFKAFKALRGKKAMFLMANLQPQIKKVLEIAQALPPESVFASIQEADEYFDAMQRKASGESIDTD